MAFSLEQEEMGTGLIYLGTFPFSQKSIKLIGIYQFLRIPNQYSINEIHLLITSSQKMMYIQGLFIRTYKLKPRNKSQVCIVNSSQVFVELLLIEMILQINFSNFSSINPFNFQVIQISSGELITGSSVTFHQQLSILPKVCTKFLQLINDKQIFIQIYSFAMASNYQHPSLRFISQPTSPTAFSYAPHCFPPYQNPHNRNQSEVHKVTLNKTKFIHHLRIYDWRSTTKFPIVKTKSLKIMTETDQYPELIEIQLQIQKCSKRLTEIESMNIGQTLYVLKQSLIGFERLLNRFGGFQITESMIAINQKGFCKVWLNQNFALNAFTHKLSEKQMLKMMIKSIERHSGQSKSQKKLFNEMRKCSSFLDCIKALEFFIQQGKFLVPTKVVFQNHPEEKLKMNPKLAEKLKKFKSPSKNINRLSINSDAKNALQLSQRLSSKSPIKSNCSNLQIKRFKSEKELIVVPNMKASEGETAYSTSFKDLQCSNCDNSKGLPSQCSGNSPGKKSWRDSLYISDKKDKEENKQKKQLTQSEALKDSQKSINYKANRKSVQKKGESKAIKTNPENSDYYAEFSSLLFKEQQALEQQENEHMNNILKNNGWNNISGLLSGTEQLKKSIHEKDEIKKTMSPQVKLERLGNMGRRMAMSILPEQVEQTY